MYGAPITGDKDVVISAKDPSFDIDKAVDKVRAEDDRYSRNVQLINESGENSYTGTTYVQHGVNLHVGKKEEHKHVLGNNNDLVVEGYTNVTIHGTEVVKEILFESKDHAKILQHKDDPKILEADESGRKESNHGPGGGTLYLSNGSNLTATDKVTFVGRSDLMVGLSAHHATMTLKEAASFERGMLSLSGSTGTTEKEIVFTGHGSGARISNGSTFTAQSTFKSEASSGSRGYHYVEGGSKAIFEDDVVLESATFTINDSLGFNHGSSAKKPNQSVSNLGGAGEGYGSSVIARKDLTFVGKGNKLDLMGSALTVVGNLEAGERFQSFVYGGILEVNGDSGAHVGQDSKLFAMASDMTFSTLALGDNTHLDVSANTIAVEKDLVLGKNVKVLDATYRDGSEEGGRIEFPGNYMHHGLTYDELVDISTYVKKEWVKDENGVWVEEKTPNQKRYDIENPASLAVGGDAILKEGATYDAKGDVTIGGKLDLAFDDNKFLVHAGNASVGAGSEIKGLIGIDAGKTFSFNGGKTTFHKDQDQLFGTLVVGSGATLDISGRAIVDGKGTGILDVNKGGTLIAGGKATTVNHLHNNGSVYIGNAIDYWPNPHGLLTVKGDYIGGEGSTLYFGKVTASGEEEKPLTTGGHKNLMIVERNASGKSNIDIGEVTSADKITKKGVLLVHVKGNSTLTLTPSQPLTSGGVEYGFVGRAGNDTMDQGQNSWYIVNDYVDMPSNPGGEPIDGGAGKPADPAEPEGPGESEKPTTPVSPTEPQEPAKPIDKSGQYSPEVGAYLANHVLGNIMFELKYHDRQYLPEYEGVWMHAKASFGKYRTDLGSALESKVDYYTIHLGKDLLDKQEYNAGVMIAYGYSDGNTKNHARGFKADHSSHGFALGLYGTYNFDEHSYLDAWAQYVFMRNSIDYKDQNNKYNSRGIIASIEAGHAFDLSETLKLQPQAQITYMGVKADDYTDNRGTKVTTNRGNVQLRLGARLFNERAWFDGQVTPYAEFNYIHNTKPFEVSLEKTNLTNASVAGNKNLYQLELGAKTELENNWTISGGVSFTKGKDKYRDTRIKLDLRYEF